MLPQVGRFWVEDFPCSEAAGGAQGVACRPVAGSVFWNSSAAERQRKSATEEGALSHCQIADPASSKLQGAPHSADSAAVAKIWAGHAASHDGCAVSGSPSIEMELEAWFWPLHHAQSPGVGESDVNCAHVCAPETDICWIAVRHFHCAYDLARRRNLGDVPGAQRRDRDVAAGHDLQAVEACGPT